MLQLHVCSKTPLACFYSPMVSNMQDIERTLEKVEPAHYFQLFQKFSQHPQWLIIKFRNCKQNVLIWQMKDEWSTACC